MLISFIVAFLPLSKGRLFFQTTDLKANYIIRKAVMRKLLGLILKRQDSSIKIAYNKFGKPYLKKEKVFFNASSSTHHFSIAISRDFSLGLDIEDISPLQKGVLCEAFTDTEYAYINNSSLRFYKIWTRKESLLKFDSRGLSIDPSSIEVLEQEIKWNGKNVFLKSIYEENHLGKCMISICFPACNDLVKIRILRGLYFDT